MKGTSRWNPTVTSQVTTLQGAASPGTLQISMKMVSFNEWRFQLKKCLPGDIREYGSRAYIYLPGETFIIFISHNILMSQRNYFSFIWQDALIKQPWFCDHSISGYPPITQFFKVLLLRNCIRISLKFYWSFHNGSLLQNAPQKFLINV